MFPLFYILLLLFLNIYVLDEIIILF